MTPRDFVRGPLADALAILPSDMDTPKARVMVTAICLQESGLIHRAQLGNGPARGFPQFELGTRQSRGGVWGIYLHDASRFWLDKLCASRGVQFLPESIWRALETDDVLSAGAARLLLFTDPKRLPDIDDADGSWGLYLRTWRPGKPRQETWPVNHRVAREAV
ncbi:hypothetical protein ACUXAV_000377 [Cupriavidus metallidurans]|uniref:hypothetical protein n=1 Tax=Cupriavidus metallidurans TaxID=119219 RepID=UPI000493851C|nr:hypothetical protein [Cupriavidus metallidurans]MDE4918337.1 hypothetical protein [Cupriavidus metallidurans]